MEGFDTMAMPYLGSPLNLSNIQGTDYLNALPGMDIPDQRSNFDSDTFVRCVASFGLLLHSTLTTPSVVEMI